MFLKKQNSKNIAGLQNIMVKISKQIVLISFFCINTIFIEPENNYPIEVTVDFEKIIYLIFN